MKKVSDEDFIKIINESKNIRQALLKMDMHAQGGNYLLLKLRAEAVGVNIDHLILDQHSMLRRLVSNEQIKEIVKNTNSMNDLLITLSFSPSKGNKKWMKDKINLLKIDISHWKEYYTAVNYNSSLKKPLSEILIFGRYTASSKLKERLIKEGLLKPNCEVCDIKEWCNTPLVMHLDHINGDHLDNRLINLRVLCPNCHSQTKTYAGKNKGTINLEGDILESAENLLKIKQADSISLQSKKKEKVIIKKRKAEKLLLCECGKPKSNKSMICLDCHNDRRETKIIWPTDEKLLEMLGRLAFTTVADQLGVSDNAVRKHLRRKGLL